MLKSLCNAFDQSPRCHPWEYIFVAAIIMLAVNIAAAQEAPAADAPQAADVDALIRDLDSEDYQTREDATAALIELGEAVRPKLEAIAKDPPSAEVKVRLQKIFRGFQLAEIRRNAVHLDALLELVRRANNQDFDQEAIDQTLSRLITALADAAGKEDLKLPVAWDDLNREEPDTSVSGGLVIARKAKITSCRDSIVLADVAAEITSAQNCVIIARAAIRISSPRNCLIIAGFDARVSSARDCVVLSGGRLDGSITRDCIMGAAEPVQLSIAERGTIVNSELARRPSREPPTMVQTEGLILRGEKPDNPLADKIQVTYAAGDVVLFQRASGGGELVARLDRPIEHPDGGLIEELTGWQACYTGSSQQAIFTDGRRFVMLPVTAP